MQKTPSFLIILITAFLFVVIHYPDKWLIAGTFILAVFYGIIYLKNRNIYALGFFHGSLGALFYYIVLHRDPFIEVFGKFLS